MKLLLAALLAFTFQQAPAPVAPAPAAPSAKVWDGRAQEVEAALKVVEVSKVEELPIGVTRPKRAYAVPGSPVGSFAWKPLRPGRYSGYWESYKSEIAAYELDKLLEMNMVPVVVERRVKGEVGAAVLWIKGVRSWDTVSPLPKPPSFNRQVVRMKMFDCLIGNIDRNKGNLLVDAAWNLYLIDHTRAFVSDRKLVSPPDHVDQDLWQRMMALDEPTLMNKLGKWIDRGQIRAMLDRRGRMEKMIAEIVSKLGPAAYVK
jgi:hypothetical protein